MLLTFPALKIKRFIFRDNNKQYGQKILFYIREGYYKNILNFLGNASYVGDNVKFIFPEEISIGSSVRLADNSIFESAGALMSIGDQTEIESFTKIKCGNKYPLKIGSQSWIGYSSYIDGKGGLLIGNHVAIGNYSVINTTSHSFLDTSKKILDQEILYKKVEIEDNVWIASNVVIFPGIKIGKGSIISAGSIVNKNVPPNTIVAGNPARVISHRP